MKIIIDTREQRPYSFEFFEGVETVRGKLQTGDYSLAGLEDKIAIERKSLNDLLGCLTHDRDRFQRELERVRALDVFAVVVESTWKDLGSKAYRSDMHPQAARQSVLAFQVRYRTPFFFAGGRDEGEYAIHGIFRQYLRNAAAQLRRIEQAAGF